MADITSFLQVFTNDLCPENYEQIKEIVQALIEMCVGNATNQQVMLDKQVVDSINRILYLEIKTATTSDDKKAHDQVSDIE